MRRKHDFGKLEARLARELDSVTGQNKQAELDRNAIINRYQWYRQQARADETWALIGRFCIVPFNVDVFIDPHAEACGTLIDLPCTGIKDARVLACQVAEYTNQSWKLYYGKTWSDMIFYSPELHHAVAFKATLAEISCELYGCALKIGSINDLNQSKSRGYH